MTIEKQDLPSTPHQDYLAAAPDVDLIRDLLAGTRRMHANYKTYIPKWKAENPDQYRKRATSAKVYGGLARSLSASVGMLFAKAPQQNDQWIPEMRRHWENIDGVGTAGAIFAKRYAEDALADGFAVILVDFPVVPEGAVVTAANEEALNLRPFWARYMRSDVLSWDSAIIDNVETVVQVVLRELAVRRIGRFGRMAKFRYRVCQLLMTPSGTPGAPATREAVWQLLEEVKDAGEMRVAVVASGVFRDAGGRAFPEIPLAVSYAGRTDGPFNAHPPLLHLAWCNLEHWRIASDLRWYEQLCAFPQPVVKGQLKADANGVVPSFQLGPGVMVQTEADSDFRWAELEGTSLQQLRAALQEKKDEMGELGASFLAKKTRGVETAEAKRIDAVAENATLATAAEGIEDGLNQALVFHARYLGIPADQAPTLLLNRDFEGLLLDAPTMSAYVQAAKDAGLPIRVLLEAWQQGGRIPPDADLDALEMEMMANATAQAERERQAREDLARQNVAA